MNDSPDSADATRFLRMAARLACRGHGGAEPNPMVGCVIVSGAGDVVGWGHHQRCGGPHAEIVALRRAGAEASGATAYVTLEPCNHEGRTGPCSVALIDAEISKVVFARPDPHSISSGGAAALRDAGIEVIQHPGCREAVEVSDPFAHRVRTGLPWLVTKWAQTLDGCIATRSGASQWISGPESRRLVHRERGRVDAILTGIGTVLADDPLLTARDVRVRRVARRVVVDPQLLLPRESRITLTASSVPTTVACLEESVVRQSDVARHLRAAGVELIALPGPDGEIPLEGLLRELVRRHDATHVLVEAGPGLLGRLFRDRLVCAAWVFLAPLLLGDEKALGVMRGIPVEHLDDGTRLELTSMRRRGGDLVLRYRVGVAGGGSEDPVPGAAEGGGGG